MHLRSKVLGKELQFSSDPVRLAREIKKKSKVINQGETSNLEMAEEEQPNGNGRIVLGDYIQVRGPHNQAAIVLSPEAQALEIKPYWFTFVQTNQFSGKSHEDAHSFVESFYKMVRTIPLDQTQLENAYMKLFDLVLIGEAKEWLDLLPAGSLTTWEQVEQAFLTRFYPFSRIINTKVEISAFKQKDDEQFFKTWDRFQKLLKRCPNHGLSELAQLVTFYDGLKHQWKIHIDSAAGGSLMKSELNDALTIIKALAATDRASYQPRTQLLKAKGVLELPTTDALLAQLTQLTKSIEKLLPNAQTQQQSRQQVQVMSQPQQPVMCELCEAGHSFDQCPHASMEGRVQFVSNQGRPGNFYAQPFQSNNFSNFNTGWKNLPGQQGASSSNKPHFIPFAERAAKIEDTLEKFMQASLTNHKNTEASIRNLENQVGQLSKQLAEQHSGPFSANTQPNPKEHCKAITTRSGRITGKYSDTTLDGEEERLANKEEGKKAKEKGELENEKNE